MHAWRIKGAVFVVEVGAHAGNKSHLVGIAVGVLKKYAWHTFFHTKGAVVEALGVVVVAIAYAGAVRMLRIADVGIKNHVSVIAVLLGIVGAQPEKRVLLMPGVGVQNPQAGGRPVKNIAAFPESLCALGGNV